jgi:transcriptional antiterminator
LKKIYFISVHMTKFLKTHNHILLKENKIRGVLVFSYKIPKYISPCILNLITNLLKSWELGLYFKNEKIFCFCLIHEIINLYMKYISDIKFKNTKFFYFFFVSIRNYTNRVKVISSFLMWWSDLIGSLGFSLHLVFASFLSFRLTRSLPIF